MTVRTIAFWFDAQGQPCESEDAVMGEIVESEDGEVLRRTYYDRRPDGDREVGDVFSYDIQLESQDSSFEWDVRDLQTQEPVTTLKGLRATLGPELDDARWRSKLANMLALPSWNAAPDGLKSEAYAWLVETRPKV